MSLPGRNDLCPCGSGKKFKKCHGAIATPRDDSAYDRLRLLEGEATYRLLKFARQRYGESFMEVAWEQFSDGRMGQFSEDAPEYLYFCRWFEYDWRPDGTSPLASSFLAGPGARSIDADVRRVMEATLASPYSFFQILEVDPGSGFRARDVLREMDAQITERSASSQMQKGFIMYARMVSLDGVSFMMGNGTQPIRAVYLRDLQDVRKELLQNGMLTGEPGGTKTLGDSEKYLRGVYFGLTKAQEKSMTDMRNADGDPLVLHTLRYSIPAFQPAFKAMRKRGSSLESEEDLPSKSELTEDGETIRAWIHWLKRGARGEAGRSVFAMITLTDNSMLVDVNSERRSRFMQKEIAKRLGDSATLKHIDATPAAGMMKDARGKPAQATPMSEDERRLREQPEVQKLLKDTMAKHWATWPDTPIPALRGMTPRQAVKDRQGRELLESLLLEFDAQSETQPDEFLKVDVDELRKSLGIAKLPVDTQGELNFPGQPAATRSPKPDIPATPQVRKTNSSRGPNPPVVQRSTWQGLHKATARVQELKPWELLDDIDLIVVRDPSSGQTGYGVFMGSGGSVFGLVVYRAAAGFYLYKDLIDGKRKAPSEEDLDTLDCLQLEFSSREELKPQDISVIRNLGLTFRGEHAWPLFRSIVPGYAPWFISESEATFLRLCIGAGCYHHDRVDRGEIGDSLRKGEYLVYTPATSPSGFESHWEKFPERPSGGVSRPVLDLKRVNSLRSLCPSSGVTWEADVFHMPFEIIDTERPYLPRSAVVCEESSGLVLDTEMFPPGETIAQLLVNIVCSAAEKTRTLPGTVHVKGSREEEALSPLGKVLGFHITRRKRLGKIEQFKAAATKHFSR